MGITMTSQQKWFLLFNVMGGLLVIASYAMGILTNDSAIDKLWGALPAWVRPWYAISMLMAAIGYLAFLQHLLFSIDANSIPLPGGFAIFFLIFGLILIPSATWMPLVFL